MLDDINELEFDFLNQFINFMTRLNWKRTNILENPKIEDACFVCHIKNNSIFVTCKRKKSRFKVSINYFIDTEEKMSINFNYKSDEFSKYEHDLNKIGDIILNKVE